MGRPTKLNAQKQRQIVRLLEAGNYREVVCRASNTATSTFYRWLERGASEESGIITTFGSPLNAPKRRPRSKRSRFCGQPSSRATGGPRWRISSVDTVSAGGAGRRTRSSVPEEARFKRSSCCGLTRPGSAMASSS